MFISPEETLNRLGGGRNIANRLVADVAKSAKGLLTHPMQTRGTVIPVEMRPVIAAVREFSSGNETAKMFGVSEASVSDYKKGNYGKDMPKDLIPQKQVAVNKIEEMLAPVREAALGRISATLAQISDEKLEGLSAKSLSEVARNLSTVAKTTLGSGSSNAADGKYTFNIYSPKTQNLNVYQPLEIQKDSPEILEMGV